MNFSLGRWTGSISTFLSVQNVFALCINWCGFHFFLSVPPTQQLVKFIILHRIPVLIKRDSGGKFIYKQSLWLCCCILNRSQYIEELGGCSGSKKWWDFWGSVNTSEKYSHNLIFLKAHLYYIYNTNFKNSYICIYII